MSVEVLYEGRAIQIAPGDTLLEGLERAGIRVPSSCRAGVCQSCIMRVVDGPVPPRSQEGLKDSLKQGGYILACICRPEQRLACEPASVTPFRGYVSVREITIIGPDIARVRFDRPQGFDFTPGQFVTLQRDDGLSRSYSIASRADIADYFDIHVRKIPDGRMSGWLHDQVGAGSMLWAEGPKGDCMYYPGTSTEAITLVGTGTGMAPLFAIADDALRQGHTGPITIYQGGVSEDRLYLIDEFEELSVKYPNVEYVRCLLKGEPGDGVVIDDLKSLVLSRVSKVKAQRIYLCGDYRLVTDLKRKLFLQGVSLRRIHSDPFIGADD